MPKMTLAAAILAASFSPAIAITAQEAKAAREEAKHAADAAFKEGTITRTEHAAAIDAAKEAYQAGEPYTKD